MHSNTFLWHLTLLHQWDFLFSDSIITVNNLITDELEYEKREDPIVKADTLTHDPSSTAKHQVINVTLTLNFHGQSSYSITTIILFLHSFSHCDYEATCFRIVGWGLRSLALPAVMWWLRKFQPHLFHIAPKARRCNPLSQHTPI